MSTVETVETFTPKETIAVAVGRFTAPLYPKVVAGMPDFECVHAFHQNVAALKHLDIGPALYLDTLGNQLNAATTVDGSKFDWKRHFEKNWANFANLSILSYHNTAGTILNPATVAGSMILKPIEDGLANGARRPEDVAFVRVRCQLDYLDFMIEPEDTHMLDVSYYFQLPQNTVTVTNATGNPVTVTTFVGEADLTTLTPEQVKTQILWSVTYAEPIDLKDPAFNVTQATIETKELKQLIETKILNLAIATVEKQIFATICPNYSSKPHAVLENIKQWS